MRNRVLVPAACIVFFVSCGKACSPSEWAAEKLIEKATGISVDEKDGSVTFKTKEGEIKLKGGEDGGEGFLAVTGKDGEEVVFAAGDKKAPKDFPLAIPRGAEVISSFTMGKDDQKSYLVGLQAKRSAHGEIAAFYQKELSSKGLEVESSEWEGDGNKITNLSGKSDGITASISLVDTAEDDQGVVNVSLSWTHGD